MKNSSRQRKYVCQTETESLNNNMKYVTTAGIKETETARNIASSSTSKHNLIDNLLYHGDRGMLVFWVVFDTVLKSRMSVSLTQIELDVSKLYKDLHVNVGTK